MTHQHTDTLDKHKSLQSSYQAYDTGYNVAIRPQENHLLVEATDIDNNVLYGRKVRQTGRLAKFTLPAQLRAKAYAKDAEVTAFLAKQALELPWVGGLLHRLIVQASSPGGGVYKPSEAVPTHTKGYRVSINPVTVSYTGKTLIRGRSKERDRSFLQVLATDHNYGTISEQHIRSSGIFKHTQPQLRAKAAARGAEVDAFLKTQLADSKTQLVEFVEELPLIGRSLAGVVRRLTASRRKIPYRQSETPTVVDFGRLIDDVHKKVADGAANHMERTVYPDMPNDRSALVAGYYHDEKGEGRHKHNVQTILQVLAGQFRIFTWDGQAWGGNVYGPGAFINMGAHTPHQVEPHNPKHPDDLNIIMVETMRPTSFKPGHGYNETLPPGFPPIPQALLDINDACNVNPQSVGADYSPAQIM